jgi:hypothetical protein
MADPARIRIIIEHTDSDEESPDDGDCPGRLAEAAPVVGATGTPAFAGSMARWQPPSAGALAVPPPRASFVPDFPWLDVPARRVTDSGQPGPCPGADPSRPDGRGRPPKEGPLGTILVWLDNLLDIGGARLYARLGELRTGDAPGELDPRADEIMVELRELRIDAVRAARAAGNTPAEASALLDAADGAVAGLARWDAGASKVVSYLRRAHAQGPWQDASDLSCDLRESYMRWEHEVRAVARRVEDLVGLAGRPAEWQAAREDQFREDVDTPTENPAEDDTAYVFASDLMRMVGLEFKDSRAFVNWLDRKHPEIRTRPKGKRRVVHAGDFHRLLPRLNEEVQNERERNPALVRWVTERIEAEQYRAESAAE